MRQSLQLRQTQQLTLTPQLQQSIRLLQLSTMEFQQEVAQMLQNNPMLERAEDSSATDTGDSGDAFSADNSAGFEADTDWSYHAYSGDDFIEFDIVQQQTLREYLLEQCRYMPLSQRDHALAAWLVESLDEQGFLTSSLEELYVQLLNEWVEKDTLDPRELEVALRYLQQCEPTGVGARSVEECLSLQLEQMPSDEATTLAKRMICEHLPLLAAHDFTKLKRIYQCNDVLLKEAQARIAGLNPHPGGPWLQETARYIVPDVIVSTHASGWQVRLNEAAFPRLRINQVYANILQSYEGASLSTQLQEARWFIRNIAQRCETILRVAQEIVKQQQGFFAEGEVAMRPLVLGDIANELGLHESTVSRVTTQKYMMTPRGIYEFKYFFGSHVRGEGQDVSAIAIKAMIRSLLAKENKQKPYSDSAIADKLTQQGIPIARRTVAKYREALSIPPVNQRKCL